jgi:hypothetical protein
MNAPFNRDAVSIMSRMRFSCSSFDLGLAPQRADICQQRFGLSDPQEIRIDRYIDMPEFGRQLLSGVVQPKTFGSGSVELNTGNYLLNQLINIVHMAQAVDCRKKNPARFEQPVDSVDGAAQIIDM